METIERITAQVYTSGPASVTTPCPLSHRSLRSGVQARNAWVGREKLQPMKRSRIPSASSSPRPSASIPARACHTSAALSGARLPSLR